jgi:hypothetical protein
MAGMAEEFRSRACRSSILMYDKPLFSRRTARWPVDMFSTYDSVVCLKKIVGSEEGSGYLAAE